MTATSLDLEILTRAMTRLGWRATGSFRDAITYWEPIAGDNAGPDELIVPNDPAATDFEKLLDRASRTLSNLYGEQLAQLTQMIETMITQNLVELLTRRDTPNHSGIIGWSDGNAMIEGTRGLLIASAKATHKPRRRFANADAVIAEDYLAACKMGQTQVGSYVVTALTPTGGSFVATRSTKVNQKKLPVFEGRDITQTLVTALEASVSAIAASETGEKPEAFESHVPQGVSYELVRALRQVVSSDVESSVSVELRDEIASQSSSSPKVHEFTFTPPDALALRKAERYFEDSPAPSAVALSGEVVLLKNSARGAEHQIKLQTRVHGNPRTVTVTLSPEQYEEALRAHADAVQLSVRGEVELRARSAVMEVADHVLVETVSVARSQKSSTPSATPLFD